MNTATETQTFSVLVADKLAAEGLEWIESQSDAQLVNKPGLSEDELAAIVGDHDAMIVRGAAKVTAKVLENPGRLKVIARAGVGVDNIDLDAATAKGIVVMNTAEANTISTAEHAFTLMMARCRNVAPAHMTMSQGGWDRSNYVGTQLAGKTLGIVGLGRIGSAFAERAMAFDMDVVGYDPFINADTMMDGKVKMYREFDDMLPHVDIITFHVPASEQSMGMLGSHNFNKCRKGVLIVNAARGGIVSEDGLLEALESGQCGGAALDVYTSEPPEETSKLRNHPKVLTTPHLGASTREAQQAVGISAASQALAYLRGEGIRGAVNAGGLRVDLDPIQTVFVDLADRMSRLISPMVTRGITTVTIEMHGKQLFPAAGTIERTALVGLLSSHLNVPLNVINVSKVAEERGINIRIVTEEEKITGPQLSIEIAGPSGSVDGETHPADQTRRIVGRVYDDLRPRVIEVNGYHMDMVPAGHMLVAQNDDRPGMIGIVGTIMGKAGVNIADMAISRRGDTALMVLKIDNAPEPGSIDQLTENDGIRKVAVVKLPAE